MQRRGWGRVVRRALVWVWLVAGCAGSDDALNMDGFPTREYILAGQTGSLIPNCGVAPLSQEQLAVPIGDALAVLYTSGCPEVSTARLGVTGPDAQNLGVRLEPLGTSGVYLVRVDESLAAGDYQLELPDQASRTLSVAEAAAALPVRLGTIAALPQGSPCDSDVSFEWALDPDALAYAALLRLWVRVDGGVEQLWVDYGALLVDEDTGVAELRLPRCGTSDCLLDGTHRIQMRAEVAGESADPERLEASFALACDEPATTGAANEDASSSEGCSLGVRKGPEPPSFVVLGALLAFGRRVRRRVVGSPPSERSR